MARLTGALEGRVESVWVDLKDLRSASVWSEELQLAVEQADALVFVISPDSVVSVQCATELEIAEALGKRIVPVCYRLVELGKLPDALARRQLLPPPELGVFEDDFDRWLGRLVDAVSTDIEWVRAHTEYEHRALEWDRHERDPSFLLTGSELRAAEAWRDNAAGKEPSLTKLQAAHITASRAHTTRRLRRTRAFVSGALVVAIGLAVTALVLRAQAVANQHTAQSRQLAASAEANLQTDPQLATLLALHALKTTYTTQAETALRDALPNTQVSEVLRDTSPIHGAAFSPDGKLIVTASQDGTCRIWSTATGKSTGVVLREPGPGHLRSVEFSPDGRVVLTGSSDGTARMWSARTGKPSGIVIREPGGSTITAAHFSPDGRLVLTLSGDGSLRLWSAVAGRSIPVVVREPDGGVFTAATLSPDGRFILTASSDGTARTWSARTGAPTATMVRDPTGASFNDAEFSPNGKMIVTAGADGFARVWDARPGEFPEMALTEPGGAQLEGATFSPDGRVIVTSGADGDVRIWNASAGAQTALLAGHFGAVVAAAFPRLSSQVVLTTGVDGTVRVWHATPREQRKAVLDPDGNLVDAEFSPDGKLLLTASDVALRLWDSVTGTQRRTFQDAGGSAHFSADGHLILIGGYSGAGLWNTVNGTPATRSCPDRGGGDVDQGSLNRAQTEFVMAADDGTATVCDAATGRPTGVVLREPGGKALFDAEFSPGGTLIVTASKDGTARVWDAATGRPTPVSFTEPDGGWLVSAKFDRTGRLILTGSSGGTARVWEASTGRPTALALRMPGGAAVADAEYSPDNRLIVTASNDDSVRIWNAASGRLLVAFSTVGRPASAVFSPDGQEVVSAGFDGLVETWSTELAQPLSAVVGVARTRVTRALTPAERATFLGG